MTPPDAPSAAPPLPDDATDSGSQSPVAALINKIRAAASLDDLFLKLKEDLAALFEVEQLTLYAIDRENRELYSRFLLDPLQGIQEIRVPIDATSVSGYCARYGKTLNIGDVYDADELASVGPHLTFNRSWDERSGFRTRQMLAVPILVDGKYLMGVLLLINKRNSGRFTAEEERFAGTVAEAIGIAIRQHNTATRQQTASQFDHLLEQAILSRAELENAMAEARRRNCDTESVLLDTYQVSKADIGRALSQHYGCPFAAYDERASIDASLLRGLNVDYLRMNYWMPLRRAGDHLEVLIDNPRDAAKIEHIRALLPGASLRWLVALRQDIARFLYNAPAANGADSAASRASWANCTTVRRCRRTRNPPAARARTTASSCGWAIRSFWMRTHKGPRTFTSSRTRLGTTPWCGCASTGTAENTSAFRRATGAPWCRG
jgi:GAF domain-containing protein